MERNNAIRVVLVGVEVVVEERRNGKGGINLLYENGNCMVGEIVIES